MILTAILPAAALLLLAASARLGGPRPTIPSSIKG
jgi:hypothetical protein